MMLSKILDFVTGREPVATATGLAAVVTAGLGLGAAFGLPVTVEQIAAIGALAAALAGWAARRAVTPVAGPTEHQDHGGVPLALIILAVVVVLILGGVFATCDALFTDESEPGDVGMPALVAHHDEDYDQWNNDDRNRNRDRNRGAFSPGPFDDSPVDAFNGNVVCLPGSTCYADRRGEEPPPERNTFVIRFWEGS